MSEVLVIDTGSANVRSMLTALTRLDARPRFARNPGEIETATRVVLPGVGTFSAAIARVRQAGLENSLRTRIARGQPTLCVCVGLQLLCASSQESPRERGLEILPHVVTSFPTGVRVPHMGWNRVEIPAESRYLEPGHAYFANSYRVELNHQSAERMRESEWVLGSCDYGGPFVAALERGAVLACQFHPELSGSWGLSILRRWLKSPSTSSEKAGHPC
jgi:imidazole glycerol phosphate synthase glutamine amidotransferase subunit